MNEFRKEAEALIRRFPHLAYEVRKILDRIDRLYVLDELGLEDAEALEAEECRLLDRFGEIQDSVAVAA